MPVQMSPTPDTEMDEQGALARLREVIAVRKRHTPSGLRPTIHATPDAQGQTRPGAGHFTLSITGEDFGGPLSMPFTVPPEHMNPSWLELEFALASSSLLAAVEDRLQASRRDNSGN